MEQTASNCLNCETPVQGNYCGQCGQKANTHRITAKHFIMHDIVHGVWHIDKGIPFTIKEVFLRPGHAAMDYVNGKRVQYYNIFYLILIVLGFIFFASGYATISENKIDPAEYNNARLIGVYLNFFTSNLKYLLLLFIPIIAFSGFILFPNLKLNFPEHIIISGYTMLGIFILVLGAFLTSNYLPMAELIFTLLCIGYFIRVYYQVTKGLYSITGFVFRIVCFGLLNLIFFFLLLSLILMVLTAVVVG